MKINIFGIPSAAGALYEGTEQSPSSLRNAGLVEALRNNELVVEDLGDLQLQENLPRHNFGPIRNWPAPRMVWEGIVEKADIIFSPESFAMILGGDCSIEVGTFTAFRKVFGEESYLLVLDGHIDTMTPQGKHCIGAAGMGLWFLTQDQQVWWSEAPVLPDKIKVIGNHAETNNTFRIENLSYKQISDKDGMIHVTSLLETIPKNANILIHLDVDVLHKSVMPAAYSPSEIGLSYEQAEELLKLILNDNRVKGIEVTEFSANKDVSNASAKTIVDLLLLVSQTARVNTLNP